MSTINVQAQWMRRALELALRGQGRVEPNPMVGCVIVSGEPEAPRLLGEGWHEKFGEDHAERRALAEATRQGNAHKLRGATAYVTLEPCCHHGKTPPCTTALIEAGIGHVVVAQLDPFPQVSGRGVDLLRSSGITVTVGVEEEPAHRLNAPYLKRLHHQRPWVIAKWAMSLDGKIATSSGDSQWISSPDSRTQVQHLRSRVDAIMVGSRTAVTDNPLLTARTDTPPLRTALRVVVDSQLRLPLDSRLVSTASHTPLLIACGPHAPQHKIEQCRQLGCQVIVFTDADRQQRLDKLLTSLAHKHAVTNLLVEGGGELLGSLFDSQQLDQCEVYVAPKLIGGQAAPGPLGGLGLERLSQGPHAYDCQTEPIGDDVHISLRLDWNR